MSLDHYRQQQQQQQQQQQLLSYCYTMPDKETVRLSYVTCPSVRSAMWMHVTEPYIAENQTGRYVWLPITWGEGDGKPRVVWHDEWQL
eukprot:COSAG06_NODE_439_length_15765_cov_69.583812_11_plen_88_part_00